MHYTRRTFLVINSRCFALNDFQFHDIRLSRRLQLEKFADSDQYRLSRLKR